MSCEAEKEPKGVMRRAEKQTNFPFRTPQTQI